MNDTERIWQDFLATYRNVCSLREQLAVEQGRLCDLAQELQEAGRHDAHISRTMVLATLETV